MKQILFLLITIIIGLFLGVQFITQKVQNDLSQPVDYPSVSPTRTQTKVPVQIAESEVRKSLFVPYWTLSEKTLDEGYDEYLYFGIAPIAEGHIRDASEGSVDAFLAAVPSNRQKVLVVRMVDSDITSSILSDSQAQQFVITESLAFANAHGFDGIALDLELSALPFESIITKINKFTEHFYRASQKEKKTFSMILYGDVFYRVRPFDVKALSKNADSFMIMAYDFHKARSNPGPNFPLRGKEVYGYDMTEMITDYLQFIPAEKLTIVFGLYGYDWEVDTEGKALSAGEAIAYAEIQEEFLSGCTYAECHIKRKNDSRETEITYRDESGISHRIWFEDPESVIAKQSYLKEQGISSFSYWANSYFTPILPIDE